MHKKTTACFLLFIACHLVAIHYRCSVHSSAAYNHFTFITSFQPISIGGFGVLEKLLYAHSSEIQYITTDLLCMLCVFYVLYFVLPFGIIWCRPSRRNARGSSAGSGHTEGRSPSFGPWSKLAEDKDLVYYWPSYCSVISSYIWQPCGCCGIIRLPWLWNSQHW